MQALLIRYGYRMIFPASFFEGQASTLVCWFLIWKGYFTLWIVFILILLADIACDAMYYRIGRRSMTSKKVSTFIDKSDFLSGHLHTMKGLRINHPIKTMVFGKNAYMISVAIVASAGMTDMSFSRFLSYSIPASFIQPIILLFIGYHLWNWYNLASQYIKYPGIVIAIILLIMIFTYRKVSKNITKGFEN